MLVSRTVSEIFSVKQWSDIEVWVRGHSSHWRRYHSKPWVRFSYSHSMAVSVAVWTQYTKVTDGQTPHDGIGRACT